MRNFRRSERPGFAPGLRKASAAGTAAPARAPSAPAALRDVALGPSRHSVGAAILPPGEEFEGSENGKRDRKDYRDYYDQPLIDGVAKLYGRDLNLFGYRF